MDFVEMRNSQIDRRYLEGLAGRLFWPAQSQPYCAVYHLLEAFPGLSHLLVEQGGNVVIECHSGSHIMMLSYQAS